MKSFRYLNALYLIVPYCTVRHACSFKQIFVETTSATHKFIMENVVNEGHFATSVVLHRFLASSLNKWFLCLQLESYPAPPPSSTVALCLVTNNCMMEDNFVSFGIYSRWPALDSLSLYWLMNINLLVLCGHDFVSILEYSLLKQFSSIRKY